MRKFTVSMCMVISWLLIPLLSFSDDNNFQSVREALVSQSRFSGSAGPSNITWINDGNQFSYQTFNANSRRMEIRIMDPANDTDELLFDGEGLTFSDSDDEFTFESFQWSENSRYILFETNFRPIYRHSGIADYYFYSLDDQELNLVVRDAGSAELSPDNSKIGFERDGEIFIYTFEDETEIQLTFDAEEHIFNGRFGWVYEEEFVIAQAWEWSPDSRHIAFWQEDERDVPVFQMTDFSGQHAEYEKIRYPKVGDTNPKVRIGVIDVENGERIWLETGEDSDSYIPRIYWTADPDILAILHLNREQNHLKLFFFNVRSGERNLVLQEQSDYWIDIMNFFEGIDDLFFFPDQFEQFFWISDRSGYRHIYRYDYDGQLINQVTSGNWDVRNVHGINADEEKIYYVSTQVSPLERHLYQIEFNGRYRTQLSRSTGRHSFNVSPNGLYYIDRYSNIDTPTQVELWETNADRLKVIEANYGVTDFTKANNYAPREIFRFNTTDGIELHGLLIKPPDFDDSKTYPLILDVYGGPGGQSVYNQFETRAWFQYLAQQGFIIAAVNNRGSGGRGRDFEKVVYRNLGYWEANDFAETANYLGNRPYVDSNRMAIRGHSYGGYMAALTMMLYPEVFKAGIAAAPVTDWKLYDSIYTERYMGLISNNESGYTESAPITHAEKLEGELLLVHSAMDENVHLQHTMQLLTALTDAGKDAELRIYPPGAHGVAYHFESFVLLQEVYTNFLKRHLLTDY